MGAQIFSQMLIWICLWEYLWMRSTLESQGSVKHIALTNVSRRLQIRWRSEENKKAE